MTKKICKKNIKILVFAFCHKVPIFNTFFLIMQNTFPENHLKIKDNVDFIQIFKIRRKSAIKKFFPKKDVFETFIKIFTQKLVSY